MLRQIIMILVLTGAIFITYYGVKLDDPAEVELNANLICLSCMGLEG